MPTTVYSTARNSDNSGDEGMSYRVQFPVNAASLGQVRVTFLGSNANPFWVDNCSIGVWANAGTNFVTTATPTELLFSTNGLSNGGHGFHQAANSQITSDWVNFSFLSTDSLVVAIDLSSSNANAAFMFNASPSSPATRTGYYGAGGNSVPQDTYNVANPSPGPGADLNEIQSVLLVETQSAAGLAIPIFRRTRRTLWTPSRRF